MRFLAAILLIGVPSFCLAQTVGANLPRKIDKSAKYLFHLHGAVVTVLGDNAINNGAPEWGPYQYSKILDSLSSLGFNVISERRRENIADSIYVNKLVSQIDSLFKAQVNTRNIVVVGASAGWHYALLAASKLKNPALKIVVMGGCWPNTYKDYVDVKLYGKFLSIIEKTDPHKTCTKIFDGRKEITSFKEVELNTGLSHGFFYKPRKAWIDPILSWLK